MDKPIPAFYCCYLLKSTVQPRAALYIGSTPNPVRRLKQHNGIIKGGAWKTAAKNRGGSKRPWEMCLMVTGFPSRIAALQFEWAWQHAHITRHVTAESKSPTASPRKRRAPALKLESGLRNLYRLLHAKSFTRWPIMIEVFNAMVHKKWLACQSSLDKQLRLDTQIECKLHSRPVSVQANQVTEAVAEPIDPSADPHGVSVLSVTHDIARAHVEKSLENLQSKERLASCYTCAGVLRYEDNLALVCPQATCNATYHVSCLSQVLLKQENNSTDIVPKDGRCPACKSALNWRTMIHDASLRLRGGAELKHLFRKRRGGKKTDGEQTTYDCSEDESGGEESEHNDNMDSRFVIPPHSSQEILDLPFDTEPAVEHEFLDIDDISDLERPGTASAKRQAKKQAPKDIYVIDDSEASDREV